MTVRHRARPLPCGTQSLTDAARLIARETAVAMVANPYPEWWGPVADLYGAVGLTIRTVCDDEGLRKNLYTLPPKAARVLALDGILNAEAFDLASHTCASILLAREPLPDGLAPFAAGVLAGTIKPPRRPTQTPVKNWHRDATLHFLIKRMKREFGLTVSEGMHSENEQTRRKDLAPSGSTIISEEFNRVVTELRKAGKPNEQLRPLQVSRKAVQDVWMNKNIPKRLREAYAARHIDFKDLAKSGDERLTIQELLSLGD